MTIKKKEQTTKEILKDISKELDLEHSRKEQVERQLISCDECGKSMWIWLEGNNIKGIKVRCPKCFKKFSRMI